VAHISQFEDSLLEYLFRHQRAESFSLSQGTQDVKCVFCWRCCLLFAGQLHSVCQLNCWFCLAEMAGMAEMSGLWCLWRWHLKWRPGSITQPNKCRANSCNNCRYPPQWVGIKKKYYKKFNCFWYTFFLFCYYSYVPIRYFAQKIIIDIILNIVDIVRYFVNLHYKIHIL